LRVRISTASGSERGLLKQPLNGTTLATARGTDPAVPFTQLKTDLSRKHSYPLFFCPTFFCSGSGRQEDV